MISILHFLVQHLKLLPHSACMVAESMLDFLIDLNNYSNINNQYEII